MTYFYLSKCYHNKINAGNKAKTDIENVLSSLGYKNAGLPQLVHSSAIVSFFLTLAGILKILFTVSKGDVVVIQYPFKKYFSFACRLIHLKGGKIISVIHDLGTFRRKKLTAKQEVKRLSQVDALIVHNNNMKEWLEQQGFKKPMVCLEIFDYLSASVNQQSPSINGEPTRVMYAGALNYQKNKYLYTLSNVMSQWRFELYGGGFEAEQVKSRELFCYRGFVSSDQLIEQANAHFGLVWEGEQTNTCSGNFGEYLRINNPHKASLYLRCNLPVIIWKEAALAPFVSTHKIGIAISSLEELDTILPSISEEKYAEMVKNVKSINQKISSGYYIKQAMEKAVAIAQRPAVRG